LATWKAGVVSAAKTLCIKGYELVQAWQTLYFTNSDGDEARRTDLREMPQ
jgi:hypothetical protein